MTTGREDSMSAIVARPGGALGWAIG